MNRYKIPIIQMTTLSVLIIFYYLYTGQTINTLSDTSLDNVDVIVKYGKNPDTFISSKSKDTELYYTNKKLELENKISVKTSILGNTIVQTENNIYFNNFDEITVVNNKSSDSYKTKMDEYLVSLIYDQPIQIKNVYATDDYYQSIADVKLESTINYPIDASIITQIKDGKRYDILIYNKVEALTYDEENNEFFIFYTGSKSSGSFQSSNTIVCSKLVWDDEENNFVLDTNQTPQDQAPAPRKINYISPIINESTKLYFSRENGLSDRQIHNYYVAEFNTSTMTIEEAELVNSKEVRSEDTLDIVNSFIIENKFYIFFSDLKYNIVDLETNTSTEHIVTNTGKIKTINYTTDGEHVYTIFTTENAVHFAEVNEGVLIDRVSTTNQELGIGMFDNDTILDFAVIK